MYRPWYSYPVKRKLPHFDMSIGWGNVPPLDRDLIWIEHLLEKDTTNNICEDRAGFELNEDCIYFNEFYYR